MMNKASFFTISVLLFSFFLFTSCEKDKPTQTNKTLILYMAANNNLSANAANNLESLKTGYVPDYYQQGEKGNALLVYYHVTNDVPKLLRIYKDAAGTVTQETVMEYEKHNSCDDSVMNAVLKYANELFPGEENGLILWSHGTGWLPPGFYSNPVQSSVSSDGYVVFAPMAPTIDPDAHLVKGGGDAFLTKGLGAVEWDAPLTKSFGAENGVEMDIVSLKKALPIKYDYIIFDACLMGCVEVAYELKDHCDYVVSSAAEILTDGFPYATCIKPIFMNREANLKEVCRLYYDHYNNLSGTKKSATISLVNTAELAALATECKKIFDNGGWDAIPTLNMSDIQGYFRLNKHWFYDLTDLMEHISDGDLSQFYSAMDKAVPYKLATPFFFEGSSTGFEIKKFSGISTYVPNPENVYLDTYYRGLSWNKAAGMVK